MACCAQDSQTAAVSRRAVALVMAVAIVALLLTVFPTPAHSGRQSAQTSFRHESSNQSAFAWLVPARAPAAWRQLRLPAGAGVLSVPPLLHRVAGDEGTVSAALVSHDGAYLAYLNATPLQGGEHLDGWAKFRLERLRDDDARSARQRSTATMLHFGATGSCVIDDYVTKVGAHPFHEIACLVQGDGTGSVIVAAAPPSDWSRVGPLLERAISSYALS